MTGALPPTGDPGGADHTAPHARSARDVPPPAPPTVTVRFWAAARAAAGVEGESVTGATLADVLDVIHANHPERRFAEVIRICSIVVGDRPVGARDPAEIQMAPGDSVEFLPPFAGG